jgi:replication factor C large subunit
MYVHKYAPKLLEDSINSDFLKNIVNTLLKKDKKKPNLVFYGPTGSGKTLASYLIANHLKWDIVELNSSDARDQKSLQEIIPSLKQKDLFGREKLVLFDDIDALTKNDRGALSQIKKLMQISIFPFIFTANDISKRELKDVLKKSHLFEFEAFTKQEIYEILKDISKKEKADIRDEIISAIAMNSKGDLRSAINDFETILFSKDKSIDVLSRNLEIKLKQALKIILKSKDYSLVRTAFSNLDIDPNDLIYHIEENIFSAYSDLDEIKKALNAISFANSIKKVIFESQYYRLLVYYLFSLSIMVAFSKKQEYTKDIKINESKFFLERWIYQNKQRVMNSFSDILSKELKLPKDSVSDNFIYLKDILENDNYLGLEELEDLFSDKK